MNKLAFLIVFVAAWLLGLAGSTYASSSVVWVKYSGNPVLTPGPAGSWDDGDVLSVEVVHDGALYRMWYGGIMTGSHKIQLGYATSADAVTWMKSPNNPVLTLGAEGSWDCTQVSAPAVVFDGATWKMWYSGLGQQGHRIGYATSPDGVNWTKYANNPVLLPSSSGNWDDTGVFSPYVMFKDGIYHMWYGGRDASRIQIGYATSTDGINWIRFPGNPVLTVGAAGTWDSDDVVSPTVIFRDGQYHMWYQRSIGSETMQRDLAGAPLPQTTSSWSERRPALGHATSLDAASWMKDPANPVLSPGPSGSWDASTIRYPSVMYRDGFLRMWYHARSAPESPLKIGYAEARVTGYEVFLPIVVKQ